MSDEGRHTGQATREFVEVALGNGVDLRGFVETPPGQTLLDVMNDPRRFFNFINPREQVQIIAKASVVWIRPAT